MSSLSPNLTEGDQPQHLDLLFENNNNDTVDVDGVGETKSEEVIQESSLEGPGVPGTADVPACHSNIV